MTKPETIRLLRSIVRDVKDPLEFPRYRCNRFRYASWKRSVEGRAAMARIIRIKTGKETI